MRPLEREKTPKPQTYDDAADPLPERFHGVSLFRRFEKNKMKIFSASLATETSTFGPMPTGLSSFIDQGYFPAGTHPKEMTFFAGPLAAARIRCETHGWELVEGLVACAQPSGTTTRHAYETLREELLADLRKALPVDIVVLGLHGAMVADGYEDCEGDLLMHVRQTVGAHVVVGAEIDPHCHLTPEMLAHSDMLVAFKEFPHTDVLARGFDLLDLAVAKFEQRIRPTAAVADCHMIAVIRTPDEPARSYVDRIMAMEGKNGVLSVSVCHGFPFGDVASMGTKLLVYTDGDAAKAQQLADRLAAELFAMRNELEPTYPGIDEALDATLAFDGGPVVLADAADNPGDGAAGDSTFILSRLVERKIRNVAMGPLWDPGAVRIAFDAGVGACLPLRIGGKIGPFSGNPMDLVVTVKALVKDMVMTGLAGTPMSLGDCALVEADGIEIVLITLRNQAMGTDMFTQLGVDLASKKMVVVKSTQHFYASFSAIAGKVLFVDAPGSAAMDLRRLEYRKVQRPKWPLDA